MTTHKTKWFLSTVGAGVLGSALTFGTVLNTDILHQDTGVQSSTQSSSNTSYNVQQNKYY